MLFKVLYNKHFIKWGHIMEVPTRVKINVEEGTIELEGREEFVSKYLDEFKNEITKMRAIPSTTKTTTKKSSIKKPETEGENKKKSKMKPVFESSAEEFNVVGDDKKNIPPFKKFFSEKNPGKSNGERILLTGYYITHILKEGEFSEGQIIYAYKFLQLKGRPTHLHQVILNNKSENMWFEKGSKTGKWKIATAGEIFVEEDLPKKLKGE